MKRPPEKHIPISSVIKVGFTTDCKPYAEYISETFPTEKEQIEKVIAEKFISAFNSRNVVNYVCQQRNPPDPDFICIDGDSKISLELTELVPRDVALRKMSTVYSNSLRHTFKNNEVSIQFSCKNSIKLPPPNSSNGECLIKEITNITNEELVKFAKNDSTQKPIVPREACISISSTMLRREYPGLHVFVSMIGPVIGGICFALTDEDYNDIKNILYVKYTKDYSIDSISKRFLLIYAFNSATPDFERLGHIIDELDKNSPKPFDEVWYLFAFPNGMHMVEKVFPK